MESAEERSCFVSPSRPWTGSDSKRPAPFDENFISKSTAGPGCMCPTGRLLTYLPAYRSRHVASSTEGSEEANGDREEVDIVQRNEQRTRPRV